MEYKEITENEQRIKDLLEYHFKTMIEYFES